VGGSESSLFADDIIQMLQAYIPMKGWRLINALLNNI